MSRLVILISCLLFSLGAFAQPMGKTANQPSVDRLIAQIDDSDLDDEENLKQLMNIEYRKDAMSMSRAVGSSLIPGAGWGLLYTKKKTQAAVPFVLSALGYGLGAAYMLGAFDTSSTTICNHERDGRVPNAECGYQNIERDPTAGDRIDNQSQDPRSVDGRTPYFRTAGDYSTSVAGKDFDGFNTGVIIMVSTYVVTTALGAVWAGSTVSNHNTQLRKDIESTAQRKQRRPEIVAAPVLKMGQRGGLVGLSLSF